MRYFLISIIALLGLCLAIDTSTAVSHAQSGDIDDVDVESCIPDPDEPAPLLFGGARPSSLILADSVLLSQPPLTPDTEPLEIITIPKDARVIVFDLDEQTESYFRVIWPCEEFNFTGWLRIEDVRLNPRRVNPKPAPPGCARAIEVVNLLDDVWISPISGRIAVVVDLYRAEGGEEYPRSFYYLTRNGRELRDREREFRSSGPFLINAVVMGADVQAGNAIGFTVITSRDEPLNFFGTIYEVPEGCQFGD